MTNANDVRRAHELLDDISNGNQPNLDGLNHLRSFLPDLPKQKTLAELTHEVCDAWIGTEENEWPDDIHGDLETWLADLHAQLQGLKDAPANTPALPAGMRLADHEEYGRCVVSPHADFDGDYLIFANEEFRETGCSAKWVQENTLTFIDYEPAKPVHPEFLETEADYTNAPVGTIVASAENLPCHKFHNKWSSVDFIEMKDDRGMSRARRRVLRWGNE